MREKDLSNPSTLGPTWFWYGAENWLHRPWPRQGPSSSLPPPLFIVGSGRSGTTLMRRLLVGSGKIHIPPESYVLGPVCRAHVWSRFLPWADYVRYVLGRFEFHPEFVHFGISLRDVARDLIAADTSSRNLRHIIETIYHYHMWESHQRGDLLWGDKTPLNTGYLKWIDETFPDGRYIEMVRDGVDVVASYLRMQRYTSASEALDRWIASLQAVERMREQIPNRVLTVRYEALVREPKKELRRVASFFHLPELTVDSKGANLDLGDTSLPHHSQVHEEIQETSIGRGRRELPEATLQTLRPRANPVLTNLGYEPISG